MWRPWGDEKVSYKIIWVLIVSMIGFTVGMWVLFSLAYRFAIKRVVNEYVLSSASELAAEVRMIVNNDMDELKNLAATDSFRNLDSYGMKLGLYRLIFRADSPFLTAYVLNRRGETLDIHSQNPGEEVLSGSRISLSSEAFNMVLKGQTYISGWNPGIKPGEFYPKPFRIIAVPIEEYAGKRAGVLVATEDLSRIDDLVTKKRENGSVYLIDQLNRILAYTERGRFGTPDESIPNKGLSSGNSGVTRATISGIDYITAQIVLPDIGWSVLVRMEEAKLLAGYNRMAVIAVLASVAFLSVLVGISIAQINRILSPLSLLKTAVERVGAGDYETQVAVKSSDEIGSLAITFNSMVQKVREAERAKTEFISLASHELRTPLTSIKGYASTLLRRDVDWDEETRIDFLQTINSESDRLGRLVSDMLDVSRIELDRLEIRLRPIDLVEIASSVAKRVAASTDKHRFTFYSKENLPLVNGDKDRVEQVLHNLYSNAVKYSPKGGEIKTHINISGDGNALEVSISDQGIGVPDEKIDTIFDRFVRVHDPEVPETGGTGLGLYITRNLVHAMGGTIRVQSTHFKGSTFTFEMPIIKSEKEAAV